MSITYEIKSKSSRMPYMVCISTFNLYFLIWNLVNLFSLEVSQHKCWICKNWSYYQFITNTLLKHHQISLSKSRSSGLLLLIAFSKLSANLSSGLELWSTMRWLYSFVVMACAVPSVWFEPWMALNLVWFISLLPLLYNFKNILIAGKLNFWLLK